MTRLSNRFAVPVGLALIAILALGACGGEGDQQITVTPAEEAPVITGTGRGVVRGVPDTATVVIGVDTQGATASASLDDNNARTQAVIDTLAGAGVADEDLQTSNLSIYPSYDQRGRINGYQVSNTLTATIRDVDTAGAAIDAAADAAGDAVRVQGITFSIDDTSELVAAARAEAVAEARRQAEELADGAEVALGRVRSVTELSEPVASTAPRSMADAASAESVPIEVGSQELTVTVTVTYEVDA